MVDTITTNADGSATINREDGGSHTVDATTEGRSATEILQETYPDSVTSTATNTNTTSEIPEKPVVPSYTEDDVVGRKLGGGLFGRGDKSSYVTLSDGTKFSSKKGGTLSEIADAKAKADAYIAQQQTLLDEWNKKYGSTKKDEGSIEEQAETIIASAEHFFETGEDDGGGFVNSDTGLIWFAETQTEHDQIVTGLRDGSYALTGDFLKKVVGDPKQIAPDKPKNTWEQLLQGMSDNDFDNFANNLFNNSIYGQEDNRSIAALLALGKLGANVFVNAVGAANTQLLGLTPTYETLQSGQGYISEDGTKLEGDGSQYISDYSINPLQFTAGQEGQIQVTGGNNFQQTMDVAFLSNHYFIKPEQISSIISGESFNNFQNQYNKFSADYDFLNNFNLVKLPKVKQYTTFDLPTTTTDTDTTTGTDTGTAQTSTTYTPTETGSTTYGTQTATTDTTGTGATDTTGTTDTTKTINLGSDATTTYPQSTVAGTFNLPTQTADYSAVPSSITVNPNPTGTTMANLTSSSQGVASTPSAAGGIQIVPYKNQAGMTQMVTEASGKPISYVPPGYKRAKTTAAQGGSMGYAEGGDVTLARKFLGFTGPANQLTNFLNANPSAAARMGKYQTAMSQMAPVRAGAQTGTTGTSLEDFQKMQQNLISTTMQPVASPVQYLYPDAPDFTPQGAGQAYAVSPMAESANIPATAQVGMPQTKTYAPMTVADAYPSITSETDKAVAQTGSYADFDPAQQAASSVAGIDAATATYAAPQIQKPADRQLAVGELISHTANAEQAANFTDRIQAQEATPTSQATVQGQLTNLMQQFEGGNTPAWAAGAMRAATTSMIERGLGASSMAGQAIIQAVMESALPIAQIDAQTQAQFQAQNLSNRQQRAMLAAQQRATFLGQEFDQVFQARVANAAKVSDIANMNFNADQQIALENSRAANTMDLTNLNNRQAVVLAEAAALSQLDVSNLNNRQQAAVQNAQNLLQTDMTNLANEQQTALFASQQNVQSLFTDQAAENAAQQFNATSENQTNQFFASLASQVGQFNASQQNAMDQYNAGQVNALRRFNAEIQDQRDRFNAQNGLVVAQANAQWRQNIATLNNAAINNSNMDYAKTINALSAKNLDEIWQRERDLMTFAQQSSENALERSLKLIMGDKELDAIRMELDASDKAAKGALAMRFLFGSPEKGLFSKFFSGN